MPTQQVSRIPKFNSIREHTVLYVRRCLLSTARCSLYTRQSHSSTALLLPRPCRAGIRTDCAPIVSRHTIQRPSCIRRRLTYVPRNAPTGFLVATIGCTGAIGATTASARVRLLVRNVRCVCCVIEERRAGWLRKRARREVGRRAAMMEKCHGMFWVCYAWVQVNCSFDVGKMGGYNSVLFSRGHDHRSREAVAVC